MDALGGLVDGASRHGLGDVQPHGGAAGVALGGAKEGGYAVFAAAAGVEHGLIGLTPFEGQVIGRLEGVAKLNEVGEDTSRSGY